jgi:hypothetical protein
VAAQEIHFAVNSGQVLVANEATEYSQPRSYRRTAGGALAPPLTSSKYKAC